MSKDTRSRLDLRKELEAHFKSDDYVGVWTGGGTWPPPKFYVMFNKRVGVFYHNIKHDA
jgi:hypothetical protein